MEPTETSSHDLDVIKTTKKTSWMGISIYSMFIKILAGIASRPNMIYVEERVGPPPFICFLGSVYEECS